MTAVCLTLTASNAQSNSAIHPVPSVTGSLSVQSRVDSLHRKKFRWLIQNQTDSLVAIMDKSLLYIHSNGWTETRENLLENLSSGKLRYHDIRVEEAIVRVIDSTALVTGKGLFSVSLDGKPIEIHLYYTEVYTVTNQDIRLISRHACKLPDQK